MDSLHVHYTPKLLTQRKKHVISRYVNRFYSPFVLIVWVLTAVDVVRCDYVRIYIPILAILSSIHITRRCYVNWYKDLLLILEANDIHLTIQNKMYFWISEILIQVLVFLLSVWWVDDLHECIGPIKLRQGLLFILVMLLSFVLHVMHYMYMKEYTEGIVKVAYSHVSDEML